MLAVAAGCLLTAAAIAGCGASGDDTQPPATTTDARADVRTDATADVRKDGTTPSEDAPAEDGATPDGPPPIEDTFGIEDFGLPPAGSRVEGTIGPEGGTLSGVAGSVLAGVSLVVPKGALASPITFAIDAAAAPSGPGGSKLVSPYVRVGPEGVAFAVPARLTLPWTSTVANPQLAPVARIGFSWSSLLDPTGDATSVTASMRRSSGAAIALVDLSALPPKVTAAAPPDAGAGSTLFLDGTGFGVAQVFRPGADGGGPFVSNVTVGGLVAETLAWSDTAISIRVPAGDAGPVVVATPGGSATAP